MEDKTLTEKILEVLRQLAQESVEEIAALDLKDGQEPGCPAYREAYQKGAERAMQGLAGQSCEPWEQRTPWQKLCVYKVSDTAGVDCDAALRNAVLFALAYGLLDAGWKVERRKGKPGYYQLRAPAQGGWVLRGDTMNSYAATTHGYIHRILGDAYGDELLGRQIVDPQRTQSGKLNLQDRYYYRPGTKTKAKNPWERAILAQYDFFRRTETEPQQAFFRVVHTVGNCIPVPFAAEGEGSFNSPRGMGPSKDYWDLALVCLYNHYARPIGKAILTRQGEDGYTLDWLLKGTGGNGETRARKTHAHVTLCQDWLDGFGSWQRFVEKNFLQDYVWQTDTGWGPPKALWPNHFAGAIEPVQAQEFHAFFSHVSEWSANRGKRIAQAAKARLRSQTLESLAQEMAEEAL